VNGDVKSASRTIELLDLLAARPNGCTLVEIAQALEFPKSSAHGLLTTLLRRHVVAAEPSPQGTVFKLGLHIFEIGQAYARNVDLIRDGQSVVRRLVDECLETVHLAAIDGGDIVYLAKEEGRHSMRMVSAVGRRVPAYGTGVGQVLLAGMTDDDVTALYAAPGSLVDLTPNTVADLPMLLSRLDATRGRGYAIEAEESSLGLGCVAAPIYDSSALVAAMSISVPTARFPDQRRDELLPQLRSAAREISIRLGAGTYPDRIAPGVTRPL
jgi:IclR family transcriptional regulator, KDG regulon repressor